jgi:anti-anti-sigma factor
MSQYVENNGVLECHFSGRLDTLISQTLDIEMKEKLNPDVTEVVFDLSEVDYLSSSFLRICITTLRHVGKDHFKITNVTPTVLKVFQIANFTELLDIS